MRLFDPGVFHGPRLFDTRDKLPLGLIEYDGWANGFLFRYRHISLIT